MTVLEVTGKLFSFFSDNDYFEMGEHFQEIILISGNKDLETATMEIGLDSLIDMEVVVKKESKNKTYWILKKPLSYYEQKVEVAPATALHIATALNEICVRVGNVDELCDPLSISDRDLGNLVAFINNVLSPQGDL
jgi:hypothetical protein|tara:strand:- start:170 stop:577 length:408 start_codon:yes stop_codon:yes gene_type:complete